MKLTSYTLDTKASKRFYVRIDKAEAGAACWLWTGGKTKGNYGVFSLYGRTELAHRISYANYYGEFDKSLCVMHAVCDNPQCVRPSHLQTGTIGDNLKDRDTKGRSGTAGHTWSRGEKSGTAKLTNAQALEIRTLYAAGGTTHAKLAACYGVSVPSITYLINYRTFKHI